MTFTKSAVLAIVATVAFVAPASAEKVQKPANLDAVMQALAVPQNRVSSYKAVTGDDLYRKKCDIQIAKYLDPPDMHLGAAARINLDTTTKWVRVTVSVLGVGQVATFEDDDFDGMVQGTKDKAEVLPGYLLPPDKVTAEYVPLMYQRVIDSIYDALKKQGAIK